ncbi:hypothetical protein [Curtobacterium sp. MCBD17_019]|uniref:hypothetical protein n=1 Tax=Curtobacterium sp. MCBD17_019 TaxID=2175669 RepID=UPI0021AD0936|nr:hypothetical protein [Curtobacterium sp. MCBD17_019]
MTTRALHGQKVAQTGDGRVPDRRLAGRWVHLCRDRRPPLSFLKVLGSNVSTEDPFPIACEIEFQRLREEAAVGVRDVAPDDLVVLDVEPVEDALVEVAAVDLRRVRVVALSVGEQGGEVLELLEHERLVGRMLLDDRLGPALGGCNPCLFLFHPLKRHRIGVVGLHQPVELARELSELALGVVPGTLLTGHERVDVCEHEPTDLGDA